MRDLADPEDLAVHWHPNMSGDTWETIGTDPVSSNRRLGKPTGRLPSARRTPRQLATRSRRSLRGRAYLVASA